MKKEEEERKGKGRNGGREGERGGSLEGGRVVWKKREMGR